MSKFTDVVVSEGAEKTEQPSEHKLGEARKKGKVAKSADVVTVSGLLFVAIVLASLLPFVTQKLVGFIRTLQHQGFKEINALVIRNAARSGLDLWFILSAPLLIAASFGAVVGSLLQFGFLFTSHPIKFDIKKIDPVAGFKRLFSKDRAVELLKQLIKLTSVCFIIYRSIDDEILNISLLFRVDFGSSVTLIIKVIFSVFAKVLLCFFVVAIFDFFWQRYSFLKSMRMSKYEVKKEYKQQEGDPHVKQERKRIHQETLQSTPKTAVMESTVVVTNPSHLAAALKYDDKLPAPIVVAKGVGLLAKEIIRVAGRYNVPIIRNVPLARDLQWIEINEEIPKSLYDSVAEVLTFINELEARDREQRSHENQS